ncbi:rhomboid family intramembrane serine protease [Paraflavisolibacter sp. H34]|uniref:rhomboid family intramembrane serine protease n=1 Tax=Huijunlia imazamoxiresistens TaxID=3127457 RepID=UPI0030199964
MLFPIGDDNRDRHLTPYVNYLFLALNIFVFIYWQDIGRNIPFTFAYSTVPAEILSGHDIVTDSEMIRDPYTGQMIEMPGLQPTHIPVYLTLFTSMFMHGGIAHLGGNMLYLWIFGDNLEDAMGHRNYLFFYLLCGLLASLSHVFSTVYFGQSTIIPSLGASGAISGVLGGYLLRFPGRSVHVWILFGVVSLPAFLVVGLWFVFQVVNGMGVLGGEEASGIAYAAHIGGFIAGMVLVNFFVRRRPQPERMYHRRKRSFW